MNQLIGHFPKTFHRYVEPFFGGGAVFFALHKGIPSILNDSNPELVNFYKTLAQDPEAVMDTLRSLSQVYCETFYYHLRSHVPTDPIAQAARTLFLNKTGFNGLYRQNNLGRFNVPFGKRATCPNLFETENVLRASQLLKSASFFNRDFEDIIDMTGSGDFIYCDPPYAPITPSSSFTKYTPKGFSLEDQIRLREACVRASHRGAKVAISNSHSPFIIKLYNGFQKFPIVARRAINSQGEKRGAVQEVLVIMWSEDASPS